MLLQNPDNSHNARADAFGAIFESATRTGKQILMQGSELDSGWVLINRNGAYVLFGLCRALC